ncbi:MAG: hypothetical protein AAF355_15850 [Myxococcota bacterium]
MDRATLLKMLEVTPGLTLSKEAIHVAEKHRLSFYLGQPGQAMVISDVLQATLYDSFLSLVRREDGAVLSVLYEAIHGLAVRPPKPKEERRPGFA